MSMKMWGWVVVVVGLLGLYGSYAYAYGTWGYVVSAVVAILGLWMAFKKEGASM